MTLELSGKTILTIVFNAIEFDGRVLNAALSMVSKGAKVIVVSLEDSPREYQYGCVGLKHIPIVRPALSKKGVSKISRHDDKSRLKRAFSSLKHSLYKYILYRRISSKAVKIAKGHGVDLIICNNFETLNIGHHAQIFFGIPFIYDSHELEFDRSTKRTNLQRAYVSFFERYYIQKAAAVFTVSRQIAKLLEQRYRLPEVNVLHNIPSRCHAPKRKSVKAELKIDQTDRLLVYVGAVALQRELDKLIKIIKHIPDAYLCFVGGRDPQYAAELQNLSRELDISNRVSFLDPVDYNEVTQYISDADLSLVLIPDTSVSYKLAMPNKLFESLNANLPLAIYTHSIEMKRFLTEFGAEFLCVDYGDEQVLAKEISDYLESSSISSDNALASSKKLSRVRDSERANFLSVIKGCLQQ